MVSEWRRIVADYSKLPPIDCWGTRICIWWERDVTPWHSRPRSHRWRLLGMTRVTEKWSSEPYPWGWIPSISVTWTNAIVSGNTTWNVQICLGSRPKQAVRNRLTIKDIRETCYIHSIIGRAWEPSDVQGQHWVNTEQTCNPGKTFEIRISRRLSRYIYIYTVNSINTSQHSFISLDLNGIPERWLSLLLSYSSFSLLCHSYPLPQPITVQRLVRPIF